MIWLKHGISGSGLMAVLCVVSACSGSSDTAHEPTATEAPVMSIARTASLGVSCSGCHNDGGTAIAPLTGRDHATLAAQLTLYRDQTDDTTVMHRLARGYTDEEIAAIATYLTNGEAD